jgi:hypothetical protein
LRRPQSILPLYAEITDNLLPLVCRGFIFLVGLFVSWAFILATRINAKIGTRFKVVIVKPLTYEGDRISPCVAPIAMNPTLEVLGDIMDKHGKTIFPHFAEWTRPTFSTPLTSLTHFFSKSNRGCYTLNEWS